MHGFRLPQGERIHRPSRPRTARTAMTIAHALRRSGDFQFHSAAKTASEVSHLDGPLGFGLSCGRHLRQAARESVCETALRGSKSFAATASFGQVALAARLSVIRSINNCDGST